MLRWICGNTRRDWVYTDNICKRLGVTPVEEKLMQHHLRWFRHIQWRPAVALVCNRVIRWISNEKRDNVWSNLTWDESVKRDFNDWCITNELALDRREWKLAIHVSVSWSLVSSLLLSFCQVFSYPFSLFWLHILLSLLLFWFGFYRALFSPSFLILFCPCFLAHVVVIVIVVVVLFRFTLKPLGY
jgi:hypothetical protein